MFLLLLLLFFLPVSSEKGFSQKVRVYQEKENLKLSQVKIELKTEIKELDALAKNFFDLACQPDEDFCWWFKFNLSLGETGNQEISKFAQQVPFYAYRGLGYGSLLGEAHIFQYPAHFLVKGVNPELKLSSGQTIADYIKSTNWENVFQDATLNQHPKYTNWELSWYWLGRASYRRSVLRQLKASFTENGALACDGAFYLAGTSYYDQTEFQRYEQIFQEKIKKMLVDFPQANQFDRKLYEFFLATYLLEGYSLAGRQDLVSEEALKYTIKFIKNFKKDLYARKDRYASAKEFIERDPEFAYITTCILGHLRYGAKLYLGIEKFHVSRTF